MELRHIRYFVAVAEEQHFARAAKRLGIAQPPLSQQIKQLEKELGFELFERTTRQVKLTPAGENFLQHSRAILRQSSQMVESARAIHEGKEAVVHIGVNETTIDLFLPGIIKKMRKDRPGVILRIHEMQTVDQLEALRQGRIDLGFMRLFKHDLTGLEAKLLLSEPYVLAMPPRHSLTKRNRVNLKLLENENLIIFPRLMQPGLYDELMTIFAKIGFSPKIVQEAYTKHTTLSLVAAGIGMAIIPRSSALNAPKGVVSKPFDKKAILPQVEHYLVYNPESIFTISNKMISWIIHPRSDRVSSRIG